MTSVDPVVTVLMIGERAADLVADGLAARHRAGTSAA